MIRKAGVLVGTMFFFLTLAATAQESRSEISVQGTGFFHQQFEWERHILQRD